MTDARSLQRAKAQAWLECVHWFAIQGPLRGTQRVSGDLLLKAEEANPYDTVYTAAEPDEPDPDTDWWTTTDVASFLGLKLGTVSSYRVRGQMPEPDAKIGRTWVWRPEVIKKWRGLS